MSPIEEALSEYMDKMGRMKSRTALRCTSCNKMRQGVGFISTCEFLCLDCLLKRKAEELDNDPEYIRRERVYNMHEAIRRYRCRSKT